MAAPSVLLSLVLLLLSVFAEAASECGALVDLYDATGGARWKNRQGWEDRQKLSAHCCDMAVFGVLCEGGRVFDIELGSNGLSGPIPASIASLSALAILSALSPLSLRSLSLSHRCPSAAFWIRTKSLICRRKLGRSPN